MIFYNSNLKYADFNFSHGSGPYLHTCDGNRLFDTWLGAGTLIFGHLNNAVQISMTPFSRKIDNDDLYLFNALVDYPIGGIGFQTSGSSAITRVCRLARAYNNRKKIALIKGFWHGSEDQFLYTHDSQPLSEGLAAVPNEYYKTFATVEDFLQAKDIKDYSALLVEPHQGSDPSVNQLEILHSSVERTYLRERDVLLICDEIITGFRETYGSCFTSRKAQPDIVVFGKAVAGGFPAGLVVANCGVAESIRDKKIFWGGTFSANNTQIKVMLCQLEKLLGLDYISLGKNLMHLTEILEEQISALNLKLHISSGCGFGRILYSREQSSITALSARGFTSNYDISDIISDLMENTGIYIASNRLIFPSVFSCLAYRQEVGGGGGNSP